MAIDPFVGPMPPIGTLFSFADLGGAHGRVRVEVGQRKAKTGPQKRIGSIGDIGPKKGSMAKIGKGQKRAPETLRQKE